jgi:serine/threonine-protein kinase
MVPILSRMLQPDPLHRPASMADVIALLEAPAQTVEADRTILAAMPVAPTVDVPVQKTMIAGPPTLSQAPVAPGGFQGLPLPPPPPVAKPPARRAPLVRVAGIGSVPLVLLAAIWFGSRPAEDPSLQPTLSPPPVEAPAETASQWPAPDIATREGLLAARLEPHICAYATRITAGGNSGAVEVFGQDPSISAGIAEVYRDSFSIAPALIDREVTPSQCPALDFVRALQGRGAAPPLLTLDSDRMASGGSLIGRISDTRGRVVWLFLVSASGAVHDLSGRLEAQADGSWLFGLAAQSLSGRAEPQLLVALTTEAPLVSAAAAPSGASAADLLPAVLKEISGQPSGAAAQMAWFLLTP